MSSRSFFLASYVVLSMVCIIAATWFLGASFPEGSRYAGGWIFGLAWFPLLAFGFIEYVNAQHIPEQVFSAVQTVFLPYVWIGVFGLWHGDTGAEMALSASLSVFIAAFLLHAYALRKPLREAGKGAFSSLFIPHLFLYVPAGVLAYMMASLLFVLQGGERWFVLGLVASIMQRVWGMYPALRRLM